MGVAGGYNAAHRVRRRMFVSDAANSKRLLTARVHSRMCPVCFIDGRVETAGEVVEDLWIGVTRRADAVAGVWETEGAIVCRKENFLSLTRVRTHTTRGTYGSDLEFRLKKFAYALVRL